MQGERKSADCRKQGSGSAARGGWAADSAEGEHSSQLRGAEKAQHKLLRQNSLG